MTTHGYSTYCIGMNRDGSKCGNKVPTFPSGVYVRSAYCHVHRKPSRRFQEATGPVADIPPNHAAKDTTDGA